MERDELCAWLRLTLTSGVGNTTACKLLSAFGMPQAVFTQSVTALQQVVTSAQANALCAQPPDLAGLLEATWRWLQSTTSGALKRRVVVLGDADYPASLLTMDDPPLMLYMLGAANFKPNRPVTPVDQAFVATNSIALTIDTARCLAVVGSRNPTPQGAANARQFSKVLAQAGLTIVSGMALGIDGAAHQGALDNAPSLTHHGLTVAVVGTGLDRVYPKVHHELAHQISENGLIISEYPLGTAPLPANFPRRNRLIAGLSQGTLVVEATPKSGSLVTARLSAEHGRDVFAVPGSIHAIQSRGCHALIKQGAKLVETPQDVLEELAWYRSLPHQGDAVDATEKVATNADAAGVTGDFDLDQSLLQALGFDPVGLDALQARTGLEAAKLQAHLMTLELQGQVARLPGGLFQQLASL